jgi:hypothetical protein
MLMSRRDDLKLEREAFSKPARMAERSAITTLCMNRETIRQILQMRFSNLMKFLAGTRD